MTTEPPEGKNHGAEDEDGLLEDKNLDDLDLESLLADDSSKEKEPAAAGSEEVGSSDIVEGDDIIELDEEMEILDDPGDSGAARAPAEPLQAPAPAAAEEPEVAAQREEVPAEKGSEIDIEELLAEDLEPQAPAESVSEEQPAEAPPVDAEATSVLPAKEESAKATPAEKDRKAGKKKFGKPAKKFGKKGKGEKEGKTAGEEKQAEPVAAGLGGREKAGKRGSLTFVCSECYEEFLLPPNFSQEMVSCPECLHVGKRPDADFLRSVKMHKAGERKFLAAAAVCGALLLAVLLALFYVISPYFVAGDGKLDGTLVYGLMGGAALLGVILVWLIIRFEGNRWEVYF